MNEKPILNLTELNSLGRAQEINREKDGKLLREITANIKKTMRKNGLTSLSAPGIGYNKRVFCIDFSDQEIKTFINPVITKYSRKTCVDNEGCLSVPGIIKNIKRYESVTVEYLDEDFNKHKEKFSGFVARIIQHEYDHLEGKLMTDY